MADYTGCECIKCKKEFTSEDDIVVCPICGTPYHRECYAEVGTCINTKLHEKGQSYIKGSQHNFPDKDIDEAAKNKETIRDVEVEIIGSSLEGADEETQKRAKEIYEKINNMAASSANKAGSNRYDGVNVGDMAAFIRKNVYYYLTTFSIFAVRKRKISFNFSALLFPALYFANRKMPLIALVIVVLSWFSYFPTFLEVASSSSIVFLQDFVSNFNIHSKEFSTLAFFAATLSNLISISSCLFANNIYYRKSVREITKIREVDKTNEAIKTLERKGGTSVLLTLLFAALYILPYYAVLAFEYFSNFIQ